MRADPIGLTGGINLYAYADLNPINRIDPFGLEALAVPGGTGWPDYTTTPLTSGQKTAIIKTTGGLSAIAAGALLGQSTIIAGGIIITADGFALSVAELLGGDTSSIPSDYELIKQISEGLIENWPNDSDPCNQ